MSSRSGQGAERAISSERRALAALVPLTLIAALTGCGGGSANSANPTSGAASPTATRSAAKALGKHLAAATKALQERLRRTPVCRPGFVIALCANAAKAGAR
jgi:hypothetical protein